MGPARSGFGILSQSLGQLDWTGEDLRQADHRGCTGQARWLLLPSSHSQGRLVSAFPASLQCHAVPLTIKLPAYLQCICWPCRPQGYVHATPYPGGVLCTHQLMAGINMEHLQPTRVQAEAENEPAKVPEDA